jgi:parallel beta-helix repeat protein
MSRKSPAFNCNVGFNIKYSTDNEVIKNTSYNNSYGMFVVTSHDNTFYDNTVYNNETGICLTWADHDGSGSNNNTIYNNCFIDNVTQAEIISGTGNVFHLPIPTGGNYWSDWTTPDADNNEFVDLPYVFNGGQDDLPLVQKSCDLPNEPPVADPDGPYLGAAGSPIAFDGTGSSDPDDDPLTFDWDWGDNTPAGPGPTHTYADAGIYDVCLTVNDGMEYSEPVCTFVVVYDPSAGFVTGSGWIDSPEDAYVPDPSLTGKANFGFVSKYKKGANVPTDQTEFQFQTADLNFHSSSYDWLVVTGSDYARFKGSGTINGEGDYKFMLWAGDGEPDTFRIKIWLEDEVIAGETVIYDNGFDQEIGGSSIVIHTKKK